MTDRRDKLILVGTLLLGTVILVVGLLIKE